MFANYPSLKELEKPYKMKKKLKTELREFWLVESEYGWDIKRYMRNIVGSEEEAKAFKKYLDLKSPSDKHEIILLKEVKKK